MKSRLTVLVALLLVSCTDVVQVDLDSPEDRLVIDARVSVIDDNNSLAIVRLSKTVDFYAESPEFVEDAQVQISVTGNTYSLNHEGMGIYMADVIPIAPDADYNLQVFYNDEEYHASNNLVFTPAIKRIEQQPVSAFDDLTEVTLVYDDPPGETNYYKFVYNSAEDYEISIGDDGFTDGNEVPESFFIEELESGTEITLTINSLNQGGYRYYETLLGQFGGGGPFGAQPAEVRGNIINITDSDHYPYGYFTVAQVRDTTFMAD